MPCFHPMAAHKLSDGSVRFISKWGKGVEGSIMLPCGQCSGCRLERSRQWAVRCMHEAALHEGNAFLTLTYNDENLPHGNSLNYEHFQKFMKRLRRRIGPKISFYMCGEYGDDTDRPHYHACIFGFDFPDKQYFRRTKSGEKIYTSQLLSDLWPYGMSSIGNVTFQSAAYIARYCMKKVNGDAADFHYEFVTDDGEIVHRVPEFSHMSLKPAIGKRWLEKYKTDVYPRGYVVVNGHKCKPPKFYDRFYRKESDIDYYEMMALREFRAYPAYLAGESSEERLYVREQVKQAQLSHLKRSV